MKIILFGSNGMLGTYLDKYLSAKYDVVKLTRKDIDISKVDEDKLFSYLKEFVNEEDLIINAAGVIKQRDYNLLDMIKVNSVFPNQLSKFKKLVNCKIIHFTTDCVFSGLRGEYSEDDLHDCLDDYGKSKSLGEPSDITVIRTSIIGEENENKKSLLEWVKSNSGKTINGYDNHLWNGITCLEASKLIDRMISEDLFWTGVRHVHSDTLSKFELVSIINSVFDLNLTINKISTPENCFRNLKTINNNLIKDSLYEQISDLRKFNIK
jgi:dTDP-4-dehydrorhamnose reductase